MSLPAPSPLALFPFWKPNTSWNSRAISAGHDRSDGGLITALLEMAFAGEVGCGLDVDIDIPPSAAIAATDTDSGGGGGAGTVDLSIATLFAEEVW